MKRIVLQAFGIGVLLSLSAPTKGHCGGSDYYSWLRDSKGENAGHTVAYFLTLPVSAGELSTGSASSCGMMDATDACFFIANTALFNRQKMVATHLEWLLGLRKEFLSACFPFEDIGTLGFFSQIFTPGTFNNAYTIDETPSHPSMLDYSIGLSFARSFFHQSLSAGTAFSYIESRLDAAVGRTVCVNADVALSPSPFVSMHVRAGNMGPGLSYTGNNPEPLPVEAACAIAINPLALQEELVSVVDPRLYFGARKIADEPIVLGISSQTALFHFLALHAGYEYPLSQDRATLHGLSAGVGLEQKNFGADFGWKNESKEFGSVFSLSVKAQLKEMVVKKAEDYYFIAQRFFGEGRLKQSLSNAKRAVRLDPNMWKAHVLISTINALMRRESGTEMALVYTGNTGGRFVPAQVDGGSIGGLARQAGIIGRLRSQFPLVMVLDAGNCLSGNSLPVKASVADWYFQQCSYNALAIGKGELDFGLDRLFSKDSRLKSEYCLTNMRGSPGANIVRTKTVNVKGYSFFIMAIAGQSIPGREKDRGNLIDPLAEITERLAKNDAKNSSVRVLIVNDNWERVRTLARNLPQIDIIVCGGLREKFEAPMNIGSTLVLSPGDGGNCVGRLVMRFNDRKKLSSCDNHLIELTDDAPSDPAVAAKLRSSIETGDLGEPPAIENVATKSAPAGVFTFLSNRDTAAGIYLKVLDKWAEFPLSRTKNECRGAAASFSCGKCAYFEKTSDSLCPVFRLMDLSGADKRTVPFDGCVAEAHFTLDGKWLYFSGHVDSARDDIYRIKPEGLRPQPVITWKNSSERYFDLSPDGAFMVFGSNGNGTWQLFITDSVGTRPICITEGNADNISPRFSPSGDCVAFLSNKTSFGGTYDLWKYRIAAGKAEQLTVNEKVTDFCWCDDGRTIVCSSGDNHAVLKKIDFSYACTRLIPGDSLMAYSERTPRLIAYKNSWKILYTREYSNGDRKIFWVNTDGTGDQRIVNSKGQDWLE